MLEKFIRTKKKFSFFFFLLNKLFLNLPSIGTELSGLLANTIST
jgi:hypothetical protein